MTSEPGKEPFKEIEAAAEWWTSFFRKLLDENIIDEGTISRWKLSLIPGLVGAALIEKERLEQLALEQAKAKSRKEVRKEIPKPKFKTKSKPEEKQLPRMEHHGAPTMKRALENFKSYLVEELREKYKGHWYPSCRKRGNGYRCIKLEPTSSLDINPSSVDAVLLNAATRALISSIIWKALSPQHCGKLRSIYMFINPGEVKIVRTTFGMNGISRESKHLYQSADFSLNTEEEHRQLMDIAKSSSSYVEHKSRSRSPSSRSLQESSKAALLQDSSTLDDTRSISPSSCTTSSAGSVLPNSLETRPAGSRIESSCVPAPYKLPCSRSSLMNTANLVPPGF